jgi:predicted porin
MKKNLLGCTALIGAAVIAGAGALAAEAPEWQLGGNMNFQFYWIDQDYNTALLEASGATTGGDPVSHLWISARNNPNAPGFQDHGWYFGVDEAELALNVSGTADNGLNYGFKVEIQTNTSDGVVADEARISLSGAWGTLQLGDEDGAEDTMNYGGEDLMGATGGFDGDFDDVLMRNHRIFTGQQQWAAPSYPTIAGDTGDSTKVTYYSPRFSGFQVGASITPTPNQGDTFKSDRGWENHYGIGANYDFSFGDLLIRASAVYSAASSTVTWLNDTAAWSVGGTVGWGPFSLGGNYTDNSDSGTRTIDAEGLTSESSYWSVAAGFETGSMYFALGYFSSAREFNGPAAAVWGMDDSTMETISLTADYTAAPGLGFYAEIDLITDEYFGGGINDGGDIDDFIWCDVYGVNQCSNNATVFIMGASVSF